MRRKDFDACVDPRLRRFQCGMAAAFPQFLLPHGLATPTVQGAALQREGGAFSGKPEAFRTAKRRSRQIAPRIHCISFGFAASRFFRTSSGSSVPVEAEHQNRDSLGYPSKFFPGLAHELLSHGHLIRFRASGISMHPVIKDGEAITVEPVRPSHVKRGDIILYRSGMGVTAHRVVSTERDARGWALGLGRQRHTGDSGCSVPDPCLVAPVSSFVLRGDSFGAGDERVEPEKVLGRVIAVERHGRSIALGNMRAKMYYKFLALTGWLKRGRGSRLSEIRITNTGGSATND